MKWLALIGAVVIILIVSGGLTAQLISQGEGSIIPGVIKQVDSPDASVMIVEGWKAEQLFMLIGFLLFNLVGIGVTIAIIMWFLNREVKSVKLGSGGSRTRQAESAEAAETA